MGAEQSQEDMHLTLKEQLCDSITLLGTRKSAEMMEFVTVFEEKWNIGLWLDSKVPKCDKWFFYFISFKCSNRDEVINEIKKYLKFYESLSNIGTIKNARDYESFEAAQEIIANMQHELSHMVQKATVEQDTTGSSQVYRLHKDIITKEKGISRKLEILDLIISKEMVKTFSKKFKETLNVLNKSKDQIEVLQQQNKELQQENKDMAKKFNELMDENRKFREEMRQFFKMNTGIMEHGRNNK